jgi:LmbE family N-acetylglucosaminyl deacetylase
VVEKILLVMYPSVGIVGVTLQNTTQLAIFLSPHFDDIPLSCGGMAARVSRTGARCIGLTVCAAPAPADAPLSPFAEELHARWESAHGAAAPSINEVRREEERQAMKLLGLEPVWLEMPDAIYRRGAAGEFLYPSAEVLFDTVAPEERTTIAPQIAAEIKRVAREAGARGRVRVYAPLGIGRHVDHQLAFMATRLLGPRFGVLYYEDYPYAGREGALGARIEQLNLPLRPRSTSISDLIGVKIAAIARYKSQLDMLFGSSDAMPAAVRAYAQSVSGGPEYAERFWDVKRET